MTLKRSMTIKTKTKANGSTTVIASTPNADRYNDVVASDWDLKAYMQNPVVQFGHRYDIPPVGKTEKLTVDPKTGNLMAKIKWDDTPTNPLGQTVAAQFRSGFLRAVSVGFQPGKQVARSKLPTDHPAHGEKGMYMTANKLLEISAVPVPANAEALAIRGFDIAKHILNVEENEDSYVITYAKMPAEAEEVEEEGYGDEEEDEQEQFGDDEEEEEKQEEEEEEDEAEEDEEEDEDEEAEKAFRLKVRTALLDLMGYDPTVQKAVTRRKTRTRKDGLTALFGIDK
tara:strand:+ start:9105 stop:9956 length:852 start_codon:yes stop_codon:yes gene_type:complete